MKTIAKTATAAIAALTLTVGVLATSTNEAQAFPKKGWGIGLGVGLAAGALIGAAAYNSAYAGPSYVVAPGYTGCRYVERYDVYGNYRGTRKVCDVIGY